MPKSLEQYLSDAGGDHEAAARAMHADLRVLDTTRSDLERQRDNATRERQQEANANVRARAVARALEPLARELGVTLPEAGQRPSDEATEALESSARTALDGARGNTRQRDRYRELLTQAGLENPEADEQATRQWLEGLRAPEGRVRELQSRVNLLEYARDQRLNPEALALQRGVENLERREVTERDAQGNEQTRQVWGIPQGDAFTPAEEYLRPVLNSLREGADGTTWVSGQEAQSEGNRSLYDNYRQQQQQRQQEPQQGRDPFQPTAPRTSPL